MAAVDFTDCRLPPAPQTKPGCPTEGVTERKRVGKNRPLVCSDMAGLTFHKHFKEPGGPDGGSRARRAGSADTSGHLLERLDWETSSVAGA